VLSRTANEDANADLMFFSPGGGHTMCKGRAFAFKEIMLFSAAIISMWEIDPVNGGEWKFPKQRKATAVYGTDSSTRVWIKQRKLPVATK
jgi:hypothetical protein